MSIYNQFHLKEYSLMYILLNEIILFISVELFSLIMYIKKIYNKNY